MAKLLSATALAVFLYGAAVGFIGVSAYAVGTQIAYAQYEGITSR